MDAQNLYLFFVASLLLNLTPGNDVLYVASRSASQGVRAGIISALGVFAGCCVHIVAAVVGLSLVVARSAVLFEIIKFAGAGYLILLGMWSLFAKARRPDQPGSAPPLRPWRMFAQGLLTNALNPKVAIFFVSFLPQFVNPSSPTVQLQFLFLGAWFAIQGTIVLFTVALLVGKTARLFNGGGLFERAAGLLLIALGIRLALASRK